jgi:hypothetical protein
MVATALDHGGRGRDPQARHREVDRPSEILRVVNRLLPGHERPAVLEEKAQRRRAGLLEGPPPLLPQGDAPRCWSGRHRQLNRLGPGHSGVEDERRLDSDPARARTRGARRERSRRFDARGRCRLRTGTWPPASAYLATASSAIGTSFAINVAATGSERPSVASQEEHQAHAPEPGSANAKDGHGRRKY